MTGRTRWMKSFECLVDSEMNLIIKLVGHNHSPTYMSCTVTGMPRRAGACTSQSDMTAALVISTKVGNPECRILSLLGRWWIILPFQTEVPTHIPGSWEEKGAHTGHHTDLLYNCPSRAGLARCHYLCHSHSTLNSNLQSGWGRARSWEGGSPHKFPCGNQDA